MAEEQRCGEPYDKSLKPNDFLGAHRCAKPKGHDGDHVWAHDDSLRDAITEDCTHDKLLRYANIAGSEHIYWCWDCGQSFTVTEEGGGD